LKNDAPTQSALVILLAILTQEGMTMYRAQNYETMTEEKRPQDPNQDGEGWKFELSEHGGEFPDSMPQAIRATDAEGRSCWYTPITVCGKVVDSKGFIFSSQPEERLEFHG
jgi:hypothetical protein